MGTREEIECDCEKEGIRKQVVGAMIVIVRWVQWNGVKPVNDKLWPDGGWEQGLARTLYWLLVAPGVSGAAKGCAR